MTVPEWRRKLAVVALVTGLFGLRAALTHLPELFLPSAYQGPRYDEVTWRADLTLGFSEKGCPAPADGALPIFLAVTACSIVLTTYGAVTLFRHGLDGRQ